MYALQEYASRGSLYDVLRHPERHPLNDLRRLKIARDVAAGML
jgi:hypothetical protein